MARDGRSWWNGLHWWDKLEVAGAGLLFVVIVLGSIRPVLAESIMNMAADYLRTFFSSLG